MASGFEGMYGDLVKKQQFAATLQGKAMNWLSQYGVNHFIDYDALKQSFLGRFRTHKTAGDLLKKIKSLKQKDMLVEDYFSQDAEGATSTKQTKEEEAQVHLGKET